MREWPFHCAFIPLDSIEANVETADLHVQNATQQLAQAADYQVGNINHYFEGE